MSASSQKPVGPDSTTGPSGTGSVRRPWALVMALVAVLVEAVVLVGLGAAEVVALDSQRLAMGISTAAFFLGYGALLAYCARSVWGGESWARSLIVMAQLIQLGTAWSNRDANTGLAALAAVVAVVVLVGIFHPASLRALGDD